MKIGIITTWFERGAAYVSKQYKDILEAAGNEVFIYARGGEEHGTNDSTWDDKNVKWGKRYEFPIPTYIDENDFRSWLQDNAIEVAFFNEQRWLKPVAVCRELKIKTGLYVDYYTEDTIPAFEIFDFLICNTKRHHSAFDWHNQAIYIPWGTDVDIFNTKEKREQTSKIRFFNSAGMNPYRKGTDLLINAFAQAIKNQNFQNNSELIIHTQVSLESFYSNIKNQYETLNNINILKKQNILKIIKGTVGAPGLYHIADVYVYPSRLDGIGLTVAEALSCGMPIIIPDDAPMNEFLPRIGSQAVKVKKFFCRHDAYYWPQNEVSIIDLANAMITYVDQRSSLKEYQDAAREHAVNNLNWKNNALDIVNAFTNTSRINISTASEKMALNAFTNRYPKIVECEKLYKTVFLLKKLFRH